MAVVEIYLGKNEMIEEMFDVETSEECDWTVVVISDGETTMMFGYDDEEDAMSDMEWGSDREDGNTYSYHQIYG